MKVWKMTCAERRNITLLKDAKIMKRFEEIVTELVDVGAPFLWGHIKDVRHFYCNIINGATKIKHSNTSLFLHAH